MKPIAETFELDGRPFPPTIKQRIGSAIVWFGLNLVLGRPPKEANLGRRDGTRARFTWNPYVPPTKEN